MNKREALAMTKNIMLVTDYKVQIQLKLNNILLRHTHICDKNCLDKTILKKQCDKHKIMLGRDERNKICKN